MDQNKPKTENKTYTLSKQDLDYLQPVNANLQALQTAINVYIINVVFPRLSIARDAKASYDLTKGELTVMVTPKPVKPVEVVPNKNEPTTPKPAGK